MKPTILSMAALGAASGVVTMLGAYGASRYAVRGWAAATTLAAAGGAALAITGNRWRRLSITDDATRLYNRRYLFGRLRQEVLRSRRFNAPLAFIVAEVDDMRVFNNTYGHLFGDAVLLAVSQTLRAGVRRGDIVARWGGDEFGVILPNTGLDDARIVAERLRSLVGTLVLMTNGGVQVGVTISVGIATHEGSFGTLEALVQAADEAMYVAKQQKNLVVAAQ